MEVFRDDHHYIIGAYAFKLDIMTQLDEIKGNDNNTNLFIYII